MTGSPNGIPIPQMTDADARRFWAKVSTPNSDGCMAWRASTVGVGYGRFHIRYRKFLAHRVSYTLAYGGIQPGMVVDHTCRNPSCANPVHLEVVTQHENTMRGQGPCAANAAKTHCINGHKLTGENTYARRSGGRACRACSHERNRSWYLRTKATKQQMEAP